MLQRLFLVLVAFGVVHGMAQQRYTIKAKIDNPSNYTIAISYISNDKFFFDTAFTREGDWIVFRGRVDEPTVASMFVRGNPALSIRTGNGVIPAPALNFFITNEEILITGDVNMIYNAKVKGGAANKDWDRIKKTENKLNAQNWLALKNAYDKTKPGDDSTLFKEAVSIRSLNYTKQQ